MGLKFEFKQRGNFNVIVLVRIMKKIKLKDVKRGISHRCGWRGSLNENLLIGKKASDDYCFNLIYLETFDT